MLVILGQKKKISDFANLSSDELIGALMKWEKN